MVDKSPKPFCTICARGSIPGRRDAVHTFDPDTCRPGREKWYRSLTNEVQMEQLRKYEILSSKLATYIWELSIARNKPPIDVIFEEGLKLL